MIASWRELFDAVEQMRHSQKKYYLAKTLENQREAKKYEAVVDACIEAKRAEWERRNQPELEVTHE
ncbi:MAG: hypothetical protein LBK83_11200 [Treponema sp.]|nr:hypothetical protein [Treponema sp.]